MRIISSKDFDPLCPSKMLVVHPDTVPKPRKMKCEPCLIPLDPSSSSSSSSSSGG